MIEIIVARGMFRRGCVVSSASGAAASRASAGPRCRCVPPGIGCGCAERYLRWEPGRGILWPDLRAGTSADGPVAGLSEGGMVKEEMDGVGRWSSEELVLRAAWSYYKDELTQDEIAKRLSVSRASVGRLLERARRVGLVTINLNTDYLNAFELSAELRRVFGLSEALVVPDHEKEPPDHHAINARIGLGGAQFLSTHLRPGGTLGVGWGETVSRVIAATNFGAVGPVHMVTLTGGVDGYLQTILSSKSDSATDADLTTAAVIPAPIFVSSPGLAAALSEEPTIQQVLEQACGVEQAVVGVGTPATDATIVQLGYLSAADVRTLREQGVVGDILGQFFDADGKVVKLPIHDRRIGIELFALQYIPKVVGVAGGVHKAQAILGALRGGFLDVLVTNELAAIRLLELQRRAGRSAGSRT
jgi:lsr operon transcriptional repressor